MKDALLSILRSFTSALCAAAYGALAIALMLALYDMPRTAVLAAPAWAALLLIQATLCELLSRRNPSLLLFVLLNGALMAAGSEQVIARTVFTPASGGFVVFLRLCIWLSGVVCAAACYKEPGSNVFVRLGDVLVLSIGLYMASVLGLGEAMIPTALLFALSALALCMLVSAILRAGGESDSVIRGAGMGGYLVLGALLLGCLALCGVVLALGSGRVDGIVALFLAVWRIVSRAGMSVLTAFGLLLARLFGGQRMMERRIIQQESAVYQSGPMEAMGAAPEWVVYLIMGLIGAGIVVVLLAILCIMRGTRLSRLRKGKSRRRITRQSHAGAWLRALIRRIGAAVAFELAYRTNRRTPQGLYVLALRTGRLKMLPKRRHESAGGYIRRLHSVLLKQTGLSTLDRLADMLDQALYSSAKPHLSRGEADAMAAQIRAIHPPIKPVKSE